MNNYLIPANTNRGKLILGYFRGIDLAIFLIGIAITFILMMSLDISSTVMAIIALAPALICGFLVIPVPYYHNILVFLGELRQYYKNTRIYHWKGWCYKDGGKQ